MKNEACEPCNGTGIAEGACGELERCLPCNGSGIAEVRQREAYHVVWREPPPRTSPKPPSGAEWSPYPWPYGQGRDYYDRSCSYRDEAA